MCDTDRGRSLEQHNNTQGRPTGTATGAVIVNMEVTLIPGCIRMLYKKVRYVN